MVASNLSLPPTALRFFTVIIMGVTIYGSFAEDGPDKLFHQLPKGPPPSQLFSNSSTTQTNLPDTAALPRGTGGEVTTSFLPSSYVIPLQRVTQPSGWGMVGEILAGDDYFGLSYRVMFDPQTSSTFLFHKDIKKKTKRAWGRGGHFTKRNHLYNPRLSITSSPVAEGEKNIETWFGLQLQDGSLYQGSMISDSMEFGPLEMPEVHFGAVTFMNEAAANIRSGTFDGIVGLGFEGFMQGDDATCILNRLMHSEGDGKKHLERNVFSIYVSRTGNSGEIRFGGTNPALLHHTFTYHKVGIFLRATREEDESNDSNESHHRRPGSVTTIDSDEDIHDDRLVGVESASAEDESHDEATPRRGSSRDDNNSGDSKYYDAREVEESLGEEGDSNPFLSVSAPAPRMARHDWMWGFSGVVAIGNTVVTMPTTTTHKKGEKVKLAFSTLVSYGLVVNARNDYVSSTFYQALGGNADLMSVGDGHAVEEAEILIPCNERASLPHLTFKFGDTSNKKNVVFAVFDGVEYFPTVLAPREVKKLMKGRKQQLKTNKKGKWCSTREFIQFRQTLDNEEEIWQLGLNFMKKYVVEYQMRNAGETHNWIGIAPSKGGEIKLPKKRLKKYHERVKW